MKRDANFVRSQGLERFELSPAEIKAKFPLIETKGILSGFWTPTDGRANPVDATMALAAGARAQGVRIFEGTPVTDFVLTGTRVTGVATPQGTIRADKVVLAAGMWSRQLGAKIGVRVPLQAAEHYYLLTEPLAGHAPRHAGGRGPRIPSPMSARKAAACSSACSSRKGRPGT